MKKTKIAEQLLEIREKIRILEEQHDEQSIRELTKLIQESKAITFKFRLWNSAKAKLEQAYDKLNEAEDLAMDYYRNHKKPSASEARIVFDTFLDGLRKMFT